MTPNRDMTVAECVECDLKCAQLIEDYWKKSGHTVRVVVDRWKGPQAVGLAASGLPTTYRRSERDAIVRRVPANVE